jgi:hypothetical protein
LRLSNLIPKGTALSKKTIALDFDGVLHSYTSGWKGATEIPDPPVSGMAEAVRKIQAAGFEVVVMSSRAMHPEGPDAMGRWFQANGFPLLPITAEKVPALLYVDDRAFRFNGDPLPMLKLIFNTDLEPWNRGSQIDA